MKSMINIFSSRHTLLRMDSQGIGNSMLLYVQKLDGWVSYFTVDNLFQIATVIENGM